MTQGEQEHPSGTNAPGPPCSKGAEAAERGNSSPLDERDRVKNMDTQPHHRQRSEQTLASDGDVKTLLQFVNLASSDIKAAMDKSSPSSRKSSPVDKSRFTSQKPMKHSLLPLALDEVVERHPGGEESSPYAVAHNSDLNSFRSVPLSNSNSALHFTERLMASASLHRDQRSHKNANFSIGKEYAFGNNNVQRDSDHLLSRRVPNRTLDRRNANSSVREFTDLSTIERGGIDKPERDNPVPLRKRRLPASFWQEPDRSENHKTTPMASSNPLAINLGANLKFPLVPSMAQSFTEPRPTSLDKNAIYPSADQYSGLNLPFAPHSLSSSENYLNRALNFQYSFCSCHQHGELFGYDHRPACAAYSGRHDRQALGLFGPVGASGLLSRWHAPPPLTSDRVDLCHSLAPRLVKPIPTKSITSYPPRYHPIYT